MTNLFLLDTHAFLWWITESKELSKPAIKTISNPQNTILLSVIVGWEICIKTALGRISEVGDPEITIPFHARRNNFELLPFPMEAALAVSKLENHHQDPFDRALIAHSRLLAAPLISKDKIFECYSLDVLW